jgi:hypothetical protein
LTSHTSHTSQARERPAPLARATASTRRYRRTLLARKTVEGKNFAITRRSSRLP